MVLRGVIGRGRSSVKFRFGGSDLNLALGRLGWRVDGGKLEAGGFLQPTERAPGAGIQGGSRGRFGNIRGLRAGGKQALGQRDPTKTVMDHGVPLFVVDLR